jgi:hypothetical protein
VLVALAMPSSWPSGPVWGVNRLQTDFAWWCDQSRADFQRLTEEKLYWLRDRLAGYIKGKGDSRLRNLSHSARHSVANSKALIGGLLFCSTSHSNLMDDLEARLN